jgi:predicted nucleic acid-binding protein
LLDTCVLAELRHPKGNKTVREAVMSIPDDDLFISVITMGEISKGIALLAAGRKKRDLSSWLSGLDSQFSKQILDIDRETAGIWGDLTARARATGIQVPALEGLIAATALRHGLHVMTRNSRDFVATGALVIDPWRA